MIRSSAVMLAMVLLCSGSSTMAQIPVELMVGHKKASIDLMFFKYIRNSREENTRWLFFSRARASVDYTMTSTTNLPAFGLTEAISYNPRSWKGFAPVAVVQVFNRGVFPKAGMQFAHIGHTLTVFSWLVSETLRNPDIDYFLMLRYTPGIGGPWRAFTQLELVNSFPTDGSSPFSFTQRFRLGIMRSQFQYGLALDLGFSGRRDFGSTQNAGAFFRYVFQ